MPNKLSTSFRAALLLCTVLFFSATAAIAQHRVTILSYNIFHGEDLYRKQPNLDSVAALINELKPDLVALQEVDSMTGRSERVYGKRIDYIRLLAEKTQMHGYFGKAMDFDGGGYGEGVLTRKKAQTSTHLLPIPSGGEPRSMIKVVYPVAANKTLVFGATHLCHQHMPNKLAQVEKLNELLSNPSLPALLAGDLNFTPADEPYRMLQPNWKDAAVTAGDTAATYPTDAPERRIDYLWLSKQHNWKIIDYRVLPQPHSDHLAILLTVEIE